MNRAKVIFTAALAILVLGASIAGGAAGQETDKQKINEGKILIFDKKWQEAYGLFDRFTRDYSQSYLVPQAYFYKARCLQFLGKNIEAVPAYEEFVEKYPYEPVLPSEASKAIVEIASSLFEKGNSVFRNRLVDALSHPSKDVRYFAAIRTSYLKDDRLKSMIVPVLKEIVEQEEESDLADRARIRLVRLAPNELSEAKPKPTPAPKENRAPREGEMKMFHLEIMVEGQENPTVELNIPLALAKLAMNALDESTKREIERKGIDIDNIWETLNQMNPTDILTVRDGKSTVKIWIK